ncbi:MAG: hypothetical protein CMK74_00610 [Pseudomonadales bacterium]|nr:hypothetical protein [Pseudomonadales bacterium]
MDVLTKKVEDPTLQYALDKFEDNVSRTILNSLILAGATSDDIRRMTGIPTDVVEAYRLYVYDVTVFRDQLERVSYVRSAQQFLSDDESRFLEAAVTVGLDYLKWLLGEPTETTAKEVIQHQMLDAHYRSQSGRGAALTSDVAKQARVWADQASKNATILERVAPSRSADAYEQLRIALAYNNDVLSADSPDAPNPDDLVN